MFLYLLTLRSDTMSGIGLETDSNVLVGKKTSEAFASLYQKFGEVLYGSLKNATSEQFNDDDVRDVVQDTFLHFLERRQPNVQYSTFLTKGIEIARGYINKKRLNPASLDMDVVDGSTMEENTPDDLVRLVKGSIDINDSYNGWLFKMNFEDGLTQKEIAEITNLKPREVSRKINDFKADIRADIAGFYIPVYEKKHLF